MAEQYIGNRKILTIEEADFQTPLGSKILKVRFEAGGEEIVTEKTFELVVTNEAVEKNPENYVFDKKLEGLMRDVQAVIAEYDIKGQELQPFMQKLSFNLEESLYRAASWLWSGSDISYIPGGSPFYGKSLLEAHKIIMSIPEKETREHLLNERKLQIERESGTDSDK